MTMRRLVVAVVVACSVGAMSNSMAASRALDLAGLEAEAKENGALARYLKLNGYPDAADLKTIVDQPPWDSHEVTLYYFGRRKEVSFARARILGRPDVHIMRYRRDLTDSDVRTLDRRPALESSSKSADEPA